MPCGSWPCPIFHTLALAASLCSPRGKSCICAAWACVTRHDSRMAAKRALAQASCCSCAVMLNSASLLLTDAAVLGAYKGLMPANPPRASTPNSRRRERQDQHGQQQIRCLGTQPDVAGTSQQRTGMIDNKPANTQETCALALQQQHPDHTTCDGRGPPQGRGCCRVPACAMRLVMHCTLPPLA
jgi:hypothetical protein